MVILFWIPGVAESLLINVSNVDEKFAALCVVPLHIMSFHPIPGKFITLLYIPFLHKCSVLQVHSNKESSSICIMILSNLWPSG